MRSEATVTTLWDERADRTRGARLGAGLALVPAIGPLAFVLIRGLLDGMSLESVAEHRFATTILLGASAITILVGAMVGWSSGPTPPPTSGRGIAGFVFGMAVSTVVLGGFLMALLISAVWLVDARVFEGPVRSMLETFWWGATIAAIGALAGISILGLPALLVTGVWAYIWVRLMSRGSGLPESLRVQLRRWEAGALAVLVASTVVGAAGYFSRPSDVELIESAFPVTESRQRQPAGVRPSIRRAMSDATGRRLRIARPDFGPDGSIVGGTFSFDGDTIYHYEPGYRELPGMDTCWTSWRIDADWYAEGATC